jgi:hypothetical protein
MYLAYHLRREYKTGGGVGDSPELAVSTRVLEDKLTFCSLSHRQQQAIEALEKRSEVIERRLRNKYAAKWEAAVRKSRKGAVTWGGATACVYFFMRSTLQALLALILTSAKRIFH